MPTNILNTNSDAIATAAMALFNSNAFKTRQISPKIILTSASITVGSHDIPVICEGTMGSGQILVFNKLDSCLGLVVIADDELSGLHLAEITNSDKSIGNDATTKNIVSTFKDGVSLGASQNTFKEVFPDIAKRIGNDEEKKNWIVYLEAKTIKAIPF